MDHRQNCKSKAIKLFKENDLGLSKYFLGITPKAHDEKKKDKLDFIKIKTFCAKNDTI